MYTIFILLFFYSMSLRKITKLASSGIDEKFPIKETVHDEDTRAHNSALAKYELLKLCKTSKMSDKQKLELLKSTLNTDKINAASIINGGLFTSFLK